MEKERSHKDYLEKTYLEELNYKIWSTKGSRFNANKRLLRISRLSNLCISMLSVYLIAVGLMSVYNIYGTNLINENLIAYSITCLSILILVFGQIENSKEFTMKAKEFHNCGLELSKLYNELRIFKTLRGENSLADKEKFSREISDKYQRVLERHENHQQIDNNLFKTKNSKYHNLDNWKVFKIRVEYYLRTDLIYHLLIIMPPIIIIGLIWIS